MKFESWDVLSRKAYWDRDVALDVWRFKVIEGHRSYLPEAVATFSPLEFINFLGLEKFKENWPKMRASLPDKYLKHAGVYDLAWSQSVGGGWNLKPTPDYFSLPKKRRQFLTQVARSPGKSIYEIAKKLGMQYRRAHEHASNLVAEHKIKAVEATENGRRKLKLYPVSGMKLR